MCQFGSTNQLCTDCFYHDQKRRKLLPLWVSGVS
jgi:hypothetical protein